MSVLSNMMTVLDYMRASDYRFILPFACRLNFINETLNGSGRESRTPVIRVATHTYQFDIYNFMCRTGRDVDLHTK